MSTALAQPGWVMDGNYFDQSTTHLERVRLKTPNAVREWLSSVPTSVG